MSGDELSALTALIDAAAIDETSWPAVIGRVAEALGACNGALVRHSHESGVAHGIATGLDPAAQPLFVRHYSAINVLRAHSEIEDAYGRRAVTPRGEVRDILHRSEYYNDFLNRFEMGHLAWVFLDRQGDDVALMSFGRPARKEPYDAPDIELLTRLMPHLMRSYRISRRLGGFGGAASGPLQQYLEALPHGVVLLDLFGRIMHANPAAWAIAAADDGLSFGRHGLVASASDANARLWTAIRRAADPTNQPRVGRGIRLPRPSGVRPLAVEVCPFGDDATSFLFDRPSVLVEIRDLAAAHSPPDAWLATCFDLTPAEARIANLLLAGLDLSGIAKNLGVAINTVRVHVARIMSKTDTHRQAELVQLLSRVATLHRQIG